LKQGLALIGSEQQILSSLSEFVAYILERNFRSGAGLFITSAQARNFVSSERSLRDFSRNFEL
jgi:hypothetical protein